MNFQKYVIAVIITLFGFQVIADDSNLQGEKHMTHEEIFSTLIGKWQGTVKTWFEPEILADDSTIKGEFAQAVNDKFIRHIYTGSIKNKPRNGEEMLTLNSVTKQYEQTWMDSFHMNYSIMVSRGDGIKNGFSVFGKYDVGEGIPQWGWRTDYVLIDNNNLTITAYNVSPEGKEDKATETVYKRVEK